MLDGYSLGGKNPWDEEKVLERRVDAAEEAYNRAVAALIDFLKQKEQYLIRAQREEMERHKKG